MVFLLAVFSGITIDGATALSGTLEPHSAADEGVQQARRHVLGSGLLCKRLSSGTKQVPSLHLVLYIHDMQVRLKIQF